MAAKSSDGMKSTRAGCRRALRCSPGEARAAAGRPSSKDTMRCFRPRATATSTIPWPPRIWRRCTTGTRWPRRPQGTVPAIRAWAGCWEARAICGPSMRRSTSSSRSCTRASSPSPRSCGPPPRSAVGRGSNAGSTCTTSGWTSGRWTTASRPCPPNSPSPPASRRLPPRPSPRPTRPGPSSNPPSGASPAQRPSPLMTAVPPPPPSTWAPPSTSGAKA